MNNCQYLGPDLFLVKVTWSGKKNNFWSYVAVKEVSQVEQLLVRYHNILVSDVFRTQYNYRQANTG